MTAILVEIEWEAAPVQSEAALETERQNSGPGLRFRAASSS
jgi:hypothetical protein